MASRKNGISLIRKGIFTRRQALRKKKSSKSSWRVEETFVVCNLTSTSVLGILRTLIRRHLSTLATTRKIST